MKVKPTKKFPSPLKERMAPDLGVRFDFSKKGQDFKKLL